MKSPLSRFQRNLSSWVLRAIWSEKGLPGVGAWMLSSHGAMVPVLLGRGRLSTRDLALCSRRCPMLGTLGLSFSPVLLKTLQ